MDWFFETRTVGLAIVIATICISLLVASLISLARQREDIGDPVSGFRDDVRTHRSPPLTCPACHERLSLFVAFTSIWPIAIRCPSCEAACRVDMPRMSLLLSVAFGIVFVAACSSLWLGESLGFAIALGALLVVGVLVELGVFFAYSRWATVATIEIDHNAEEDM